MTAQSECPTALSRDVIADPNELRRIYAQSPSGVAAICGLDGDRPIGTVMSTFVSVSLDPAIVSVCVRKSSKTWPHMRRLGSVGLSILGWEHSANVRRLAGDAANRFDGIRWAAAPSGAVFLPSSSAWMECEIKSEIDVGDHFIVVLDVRSAASFPDVSPLVFQGKTFHNLHAEVR